MYDLSALLKGNAYPGRGVLLGRSEDGKSAVIAYFIMGRSENSRNRIFVETEDGIRTQAFDPAKMTDPSLIIYHPVRRIADEDGITTIVTNGDQTDTLRDFMLEPQLHTQDFGHSVSLRFLCSQHSEVPARRPQLLRPKLLHL